MIPRRSSKILSASTAAATAAAADSSPALHHAAEHPRVAPPCLLAALSVWPTSHMSSLPLAPSSRVLHWAAPSLSPHQIPDLHFPFPFCQIRNSGYTAISQLLLHCSSEPLQFCLTSIALRCVIVFHYSDHPLLASNFAKFRCFDAKNGCLFILM